MFSGLVSADPIDNPGNYVWDTGWGELFFNEASTFSRTLPASSGTLDVDFDSSGNITYNVFTIHSVVVSPYTVLVQVLVGSSSGTLDASVGGFNSSMTLQLRIKITGGLGGGVGTNCVTSSFSAPFEGEYSYNASTQEGEWLMYSNTGGSTGDGWLVVPAMTGGCNGQEGGINSTFGFGSGNKGLSIGRLRALTTPGPQGS